MKRTQIISKFLFLIFRILSVIYGLLVIYSAFCLLTGIFTTPYGDGKFLHINYPFTQNPLMNIDDNWSYILFSFLLPLTLYAVFFYLASKVFLVFLQGKLFTERNVKILRQFYFVNLFIPLPLVLISSLFVEVEFIVWLLVLVHFVLGIFIFFLSEIFMQGVKLQNEQDLII